MKLTEAQSTAIGKLLKPAGARHPWPDQIGTHWGRDSKTPIVKVRPAMVVEVAADAALQAGHYRHPWRLVRCRTHSLCSSKGAAIWRLPTASLDTSSPTN